MIKNLTIVTLKKSKIADFAEERNQLIKQLKTKWVFFVDSDEKISKELLKEIKQAIKNNQYNYQLKRQDWFLGKKLRFGETALIRFTRLIQKKTGQWQGKVHETFKSKLAIKTLKHPLIHQRDINVSQFLDRLNSYTNIRTKELLEQDQLFSLFQLLFYPPLKFIHNYIFRLGFLDGLPGLAIAFMMSLHSLFIRIKLYEVQKKTQ